LRVCVCTPPPHVRVHADHAVHDDTEQWTGQFCVLQFLDCERAGHAAPPLAAATTIDRVCVCEPPPQEAEHLDHADQPLTTQWTGHAWVLHACCCVNDGHAVPPNAAVVMTDRMDIWLPRPHGAEHAPHGDHDDTTQLRGHGCLLQLCVCDSEGHAAPPFLG